MKITKVLISVLAFFCTILLSSCNPVFYAPNGHNVPLFRKKHEANLRAGIATTEDLSGLQVQAAYAAGSNIGIIANYLYLDAISDGYYGNGHLTELGAGYFKPVSKKFVFETYGGGGFGKITNKHSEAKFTDKLATLFVQPAFGFTSKYLDIAFSPKLTVLHYAKPDGSYSNYYTDSTGTTIYYTRLALASFTNQRNFIAFEPGLTVRTGWKYTKLQLQYIHSFTEVPNQNNTNLNLSLSFSLAPRFRKSAE